MAFQFKSMQKFIGNVIYPYVVNLKDLFNSQLVDLDTHISNKLDALEKSLVPKLDALQQQINTISASLNSHINDKNNPHNVKYNQTATVSSSTPSSYQGSSGDTWSTHL